MLYQVEVRNRKSHETPQGTQRCNQGTAATVSVTGNDSANDLSICHPVSGSVRRTRVWCDCIPFNILNSPFITDVGISSRYVYVYLCTQYYVLWYGALHG
ncbi:hypothetical protein U1Q18_051847 [Sarracenia purpurea var. burkii]